MTIMNTTSIELMYKLQITLYVYEEIYFSVATVKPALKKKITYAEIAYFLKVFPIQNYIYIYAYQF